MSFILPSEYSSFYLQNTLLFTFRILFFLPSEYSSFYLQNTLLFTFRILFFLPWEYSSFYLQNTLFFYLNIADFAPISYTLTIIRSHSQRVTKTSACTFAKYLGDDDGRREGGRIAKVALDTEPAIAFTLLHPRTVQRVEAEKIHSKYKLLTFQEQELYYCTRKHTDLTYPSSLTFITVSFSLHNLPLSIPSPISLIEHSLTLTPFKHISPTIINTAAAENQGVSTKVPW